MKKKPLILIGAGGHAKSCIDIIENENRYYIFLHYRQIKKIFYGLQDIGW